MITLNQILSDAIIGAEITYYKLITKNKAGEITDETCTIKRLNEGNFLTTNGSCENKKITSKIAILTGATVIITENEDTLFVSPSMLLDINMPNRTALILDAVREAIPVVIPIISEHLIKMELNKQPENKISKLDTDLIVNMNVSKRAKLALNNFVFNHELSVAKLTVSYLLKCKKVDFMKTTSCNPKTAIEIRNYILRVYNINW